MKSFALSKLRPLRHAVYALAGLSCSAALASSPSFTDVTLGTASDLTIFNMGPTQFSASNGSTYFEGNAALAAGASTNFSGGGTLTGTLYVDPSATVQSNLASQFNVQGGVTTSSLAQAVADVTTASQTAALLTATQTFAGNLSNGFTFSTAGDYNVVNITGNLSITDPGKNVTLFGAADDYFIVNVFGSLSVSNGTFGLAGGLLADHVLVNVLGGDISVSNSQSSLYGTFLDVDHTINLTPGSVYGAVMGRQIHTSSGPKVYQHIYSAPVAVSPVPEPASFALLLAGLVPIALTVRRRMAAAQ